MWVSIGVHLIVLILALMWVLKIVPAEPEKRVDFTPRFTGGGGGSPSVKSIRREPTARLARSNLPRIAAVDVASTIVLPEPGDGSGFTTLSSPGSSSLSAGLGGSGSGGGWGSGHGTGFGAGIGSGTSNFGPVRFFNQETKATRIAYVIDFSKSMSGKRQKLMRGELSKSISGLTSQQQYQLIFFAGPVWVAGSIVTMADDRKSSVVTSNKGDEHRWTAIDGGRWKVSGPPPEISWLTANRGNLERSSSIIRETELVFGTYWKPAIDLALDLKPAPEVIYFMTDGIVSKNVDTIIDDLSRTARRRKCVIHTIAMMEPQAGEAMKDLARKTGGTFTMIRNDGSTDPAANPAP